MIVKAPIAKAVIAHAFFAEAPISYTAARADCLPLPRARAVAPRPRGRDGPQRPLAPRPAALRPALPGARRCRGALSRPRRRQHAGLAGRPEVADRPGIHRRRPGRSRDGAARALLR